MEHPIPPNHPNRWHTRVTVEVVRSSGHRSYMEFRDAQMAYMWIEDFTRSPQDGYTRKTFEEVCTELDTEYLRMGLLGFVPVAQNETTQLTIFYGVVRLM
jgi:hypothetical protein